MSLYFTKVNFELCILIFSPACNSCKHTAFSIKSLLLISIVRSFWIIDGGTAGYNWKKYIILKVTFDLINLHVLEVYPSI